MYDDCGVAVMRLYAPSIGRSLAPTACVSFPAGGGDAGTAVFPASIMLPEGFGFVLLVVVAYSARSHRAYLLVPGQSTPVSDSPVTSPH